MNPDTWVANETLLYSIEDAKIRAKQRKHIALQPEDYEFLAKFAREKGLQLTKAVIKAVNDSKKLDDIKASFYDSRIDLALWYFEKLCFSIQVLKQTKSENQLKRVKKLLKQVEERYNIDTKLMSEVSEAFIKGDADIVTVNETLKELGKMILRRVMLNEC